MKNKLKHCPKILLALLVASSCASACGAVHKSTLAAAPRVTGPYDLQCERLHEPLGIDARNPLFSWKLQDARNGARQSAYRLTVFKTAPSAAKRGEGAPLWDSGRIPSSQSLNIRYGGPALEPSTRYFWRVRLWDAHDHAYPPSPATWWETGLLGTPWHATWTGYESAELQAVRNSGAMWITNPPEANAKLSGTTHHAFRLHIALPSPVRRAVLYATGEDTLSAWINDAQVMQPEEMMADGRIPWATYRSAEVSSSLRQGDNILAVEVLHLNSARDPLARPRAVTPMSACLYVELSDGSTRAFSSDTAHWRSRLEPSAGWHAVNFDDRSWLAPQPFSSFEPEGADTRHAPWPTGPVSLLRRTFVTARPIRSARLYATALGSYSFRLNGKPISDERMAPGWTDYRQRVLYQTYDVTSQLGRGTNTLIAHLAPGWYSTPLKWAKQGNNYGETQPALLAQIRITYTDGSVEWIGTGADWTGAPSSTLKAELYDGETHDNRIEQPGADPSSNASVWPPVQIVHPKEPSIVAQDVPPIRGHAPISARSVQRLTSGVFVYDFGQNMSAVPRIRLHGARGTLITMRFAEVLNDDGSLYTANLRSAQATDRVTLAGGHEEQFEPEFTSHGFRYMEIAGLQDAPVLRDVEIVPLYSDLPETTVLETGNDLVNSLVRNTIWGQRSNFLSVPTDCPQRDERLGWTADAQVFWRTASFNMDLTNFSRSFAANLRGTQVPGPKGTSMYGIYAPGVDRTNAGFAVGWSDAGVIIPWTSWIQDGDTRIVDENWTSMEAYLAEIERNNPDHLWRNAQGTRFGDWLTPTQTTPVDLLGTAYWAYDAALMAQMAAATGRGEAAKHYESLANSVQQAFRAAYLHADGTVSIVDRYPSIPPPSLTHSASSSAGSTPVETQTGYVLALQSGSVPDSMHPAVADALLRKIHSNGDKLGTGFLGTPYLLEVLADAGHSAAAYSLLLARTYPSWGYLVDRGATTMWERWNGDQMRADPSMNSYNHYAYGAVVEWLFRYAAGVDTVPSAPGFRVIRLHPVVDQRLGFLRLRYESPYGAVTSEWRVAPGNHVTWKVIVPANASAEIDLDQTNLTDLKGELAKPEDHILKLASGTHTFTATIKWALPSGASLAQR